MFPIKRRIRRRVLNDLEATFLMADFAGNNLPVPSHRVRSWPKRPIVFVDVIDADCLSFAKAG